MLPSAKPLLRMLLCLAIILMLSMTAWSQSIFGTIDGGPIPQAQHLNGPGIAFADMAILYFFPWQTDQDCLVIQALVPCVGIAPPLGTIPVIRNFGDQRYAGVRGGIMAEVPPPT